MVDHRPVAVFGATGQVGRAVADGLHAAGVPVRGIVRCQPQRATLWPVYPVQRWDADTLAPVLSGCRAAFCMVPLVPQAGDLGLAQHRALAAAGIEHVVRLSVLREVIQAQLRLGQLHGALDEDFRRHGFAGAILHPDSFMQNLLGSAASIRAGVLQDATGDGAMGWIDAADIAAVASSLLKRDRDGQLHALNLTGPEMLTHRDVATRLGQWLGRPVTYQDLSPAALGDQLRRYGVPVFLVDIFCELAAWTRSTDVTRLPTPPPPQWLARAPHRLEQFLAAHNNVFPATAPG